MTKSHVLRLENELVRLKASEGKNVELIERTQAENEDLKKYIRLADLIRKAVGISSQEREELTKKFQSKRLKHREAKFKLARDAKERDRLKERVDLLEKEIAKIKGNPLEAKFIKVSAVFSSKSDF